MKVLTEWFPVTIYDWEEILLGLGETFYRKEHLPDYDVEHYSIDRPAAVLMHGALLAALYDGIDLKMRPEYPIMLAGRKIFKKNGKLVASKHQCMTSVVKELFFTDYGPAVRTESGTEYLLMGEDRAFEVYEYLKGCSERPDLISSVFNVI